MYLGGVIAGQIYTATSAPQYRLGHAVTLGGIVLGFVGYNIQYFGLRSMNRKRDAIQAHQDSEPSGIWATKNGDSTLDFRYHL